MSSFVKLLANNITSIFAFLTPKELANVAAVSKLFKERSEQEHLWQAHFVTTFCGEIPNSEQSLKAQYKLFWISKTLIFKNEVFGCEHMDAFKRKNINGTKDLDFRRYESCTFHRYMVTYYSDHYNSMTTVKVVTFSQCKFSVVGMNNYFNHKVFKDKPVTFRFIECRGDDKPLDSKSPFFENCKKIVPLAKFEVIPD